MKLKINQHLSQADPYVIKVGDKYYMYVTGEQGVMLFESADFFSWNDAGVCYRKFGEYEYWAPSVIEFNEKYYMYVSSMPIGEKDTHKQRIQVAVSSSPKGPFHFIRFITPEFSIDPHVVLSGEDLYIFYATNVYEAERVGTVVVLDKMYSPLEVVGEPKIVVRPTLDEEIFMKDRFKKGEHWHTIEGPFYYRKGNYHYLFYSGNCYQNENYFVGYAVAYGNTDELLTLEFKKFPSDNIYSPLLRKNEFEEGTGHNSVLDVGDKTYIIYHGRDYDASKDEDHRTARICEIKLDKENITVVDR